MYQRLIDQKNKLGLSNKEIEEGSGSSQRTIERIFSENPKNYKRGCSVDTLRPILKFLNLSFEEVFEDTPAYLGNSTFTELQNKVDNLTTTKDYLLTRNKVLEEEVKALTARIELLVMELRLKDEIISLHKVIEEERNK